MSRLARKHGRRHSITLALALGVAGSLQMCGGEPRSSMAAMHVEARPAPQPARTSAASLPQTAKVPGVSANPKAAPSRLRDREAGGQPRERDLWFTDARGREAIVAREQRDFVRSVALLDTMLADTALSSHDVAGALWLRALNHREAGEYLQAAERLAEARKQPHLALVEDHLRVQEAQARLDGGQPERALELVDAKPEVGPALLEAALMIRADARLRLDDPAGAERLYRRYLELFSRQRRVHEARIKLARLLERRRSQPTSTEALELYARLVLDVPLSSYGEEAAQGYQRLRKRLGMGGKRVQAFARERSLSRIDALVEYRRHTEAIAEAKAFLRQRKLPHADRCRGQYAQAKAVFSQRQRGAARPLYERAADACVRAGGEYTDLVVKARFQAARGLYAEGRYPKAVEAFRRVATIFPAHSYADDALLLAGESWEAHGDRHKMQATYAEVLDMFPTGDMADEARRRLIVEAMQHDDFDRVLELCEQGLGRQGPRPERSALLYFRGRALASRADQTSANTAWIEAIRVEPLGYTALQALSRLRAQGTDALVQGLSVLETEAPDVDVPKLELLASRAGQRAELLARLGLGDAARAELEVGGVGGWPAVAVLVQAGLHAEAQIELARMSTAWRLYPPVGAMREAWELAHPRPFHELVHERERAFDLPQWLTFAVMQTESRFDPGAVSVAGARGLIQLMPSTAKDVAARSNVTLGDVSRLHDPSTNLDLGMRHLSDLVHKRGAGNLGVVLAVPSYNAGAGAVDRWLRQHHGDLDLFVERIPYDETRNYTQRVLGRWFAYRWLYDAGEASTRVPYLPLETALP